MTWGGRRRGNGRGRAGRWWYHAAAGGWRGERVRGGTMASTNEDAVALATARLDDGRLLMMRHLPDRGTIEIGWWRRDEGGVVAQEPPSLELAAEGGGIHPAVRAGGRGRVGAGRRRRGDRRGRPVRRRRPARRPALRGRGGLHQATRGRRPGPGTQDGAGAARRRDAAGGRAEAKQLWR